MQLRYVLCSVLVNAERLKRIAVVKYLLQQSNLTHILGIDGVMKHALNIEPRALEHASYQQCKNMYLYNTSKSENDNVSVIPNQSDTSPSNKINRFMRKTHVETLTILNPTSKRTAQMYDHGRMLEYLKLSKNSPMFGYLKQLITSRKKRQLDQKLVVEGSRLILDALNAGLILECLLFKEANQLDCFDNLSKTVKLIQLNSHILQQWSNLVTCPGIIGIFYKPKNMNDLISKNKTATSLPITVLCENIREPNNLGSIIRSCGAIPVYNIVLLKGCTHPWEPKCLRGSAGAHFRTQISGPIAMTDIVKHVPPNSHFLIADNARDGRGDELVVRRYDLINYCIMEHIVLVVGGETHGVSSDLRRFAQKLTNNTGNFHNNLSIHIPLANGIESLNVASAISVILCEIRRQLTS
ncbi:rRNA methyltransferase 3, mitochondrial [Wyeomyia smithii]|uniref:rRNA methyltransferase 3, mitochondrial n=1 Tax=Wyeomyia smithii TaxID=174621 RepID=UPI002467ED6B|nr:rRNA methyltransferase 3, mitochondrial [Wyeomyia smithii]